MKTKLLVVLVLLTAGYWLGASRHASPGKTTDRDEAVTTEYTCSMHPQIRQPGPGLCPLCAMDLVPVGNAGGVDPGPRAIALSPSARQLARIEVAPVTQGEAVVEVSLAGTIAYDPARKREVVLLAEGQARRLYANAVGMRIRKDEPLAEIYSPEVFAASRELAAAGANKILAEAARQKLELFGVGPGQVDRQVGDTFTLLSPLDGVVTDVPGAEGVWLMKGDRLLTVADASVVWAELDAFEQDIALLRSGLVVNLSTPALPGETFNGTVTLVPAEIDSMRRSSKVRVEIDNAGGRLLAGMFVRGEVLVPAGEGLLIPATAILQAGKRAIVYVQSPEDEAVFEGRIVVPGPRAGNQVMIQEGLRAGELVAMRGAMRIDSSLQLFAKPSMMSMPPEQPSGAGIPQSRCPIMGGRIDRTSFIDYGGFRIYFCCPGCDEDFLMDPDKYLERMRAEGIALEHSPAPAPQQPHDHH